MNLKRPITIFLGVTATLLCLWGLYAVFIDGDRSSNTATPETKTPGIASTPNITNTPAIVQDKQPVSRPEDQPATPEATELTNGLSITGAILTARGEPVMDMEVMATPRRVFASPEEQAAAQRTTRSETNGQYRLFGLGRGDWQLRTLETARYPSARITVRAGSDAVNLVLTPYQDLWIYGVVNDAGNAPLADVHIVPVGEPANIVYSDTQGRFGLFQRVRGGARSPDGLVLSLDGYHDKRLPLRSTDPYANELPLGTLRLERIDGQADVRGAVTADYAPVVNARVFLRATARSDHYNTTTDGGGFFALPDVVLGDYALTVVAPGTHQDYSESDLSVTASGLDLEIALQPLQSGRLHGQMVDVNGQPVANFSLWLTSLSARSRGSQPLHSDARGHFDVPSLPAGAVRLATHSNPRLRVTGVEVVLDEASPVRLTLDVGNHAFTGRVVDAYANPVPGAQISLVWSHDDSGTSSHAVRNTTSDAGGVFRFAQLGPGPHTLNINATGFARQRITHDVGVSDELQIELAPSASRR